MSDFITLYNLTNSEDMTMIKFIILMVTLIILMLIYKAPDIYRAYKDYSDNN